MLVSECLNVERGRCASSSPQTGHFVVLRKNCSFGNRFCGFATHFCESEKAAEGESGKLKHRPVIGAWVLWDLRNFFVWMAMRNMMHRPIEQIIVSLRPHDYTGTLRSTSAWAFQRASNLGS